MDDEQTFLELAAQMMAEGINLDPPANVKMPPFVEDLCSPSSPGADVLADVYGPDWRNGITEVPDEPQQVLVNGYESPSEAWQALAARHVQAARFGIKVNRIVSGLAACVGVFIGVGLDALIREVVR